MATSPPIQFADWTKVNSLFDNAANERDRLQNVILSQQGQKLGLENQYTSAVQPVQINGLLQALGQMNGPQVSTGGAPAPDDTGSGGLTVTPVQPGQSLLAGEMPVSKDAAAQQRVMKIAQEEGINPEWAGRTQYAESGSFPNSMTAISPAGARGTMQLMPNTAGALGVDPDHPEQNARGGVRYLKQMKDQFGDPVIATAAYNAGPGRVQSWLAGQGTLPTETVNYVGKVFGGDGIQLLNNAMGGGHGHAIGGVPATGTGGLQTVPMDRSALNELGRLISMREIAMAQPNGSGARAAAAFQSALDNIAGPGGIATRTGVYRVPGSFSTRAAAALAAAQGKVGPETQLAANKGAIEQGTHLANARVDLQAAGMRPTKIGPNENIVIPVPGQLGGSGALPLGADGTPQAPASVPTELYHGAPEAPVVTFNKKEGERWSDLAGNIPKMGSEAARAVATIDSAQSQLEKASQSGIPTGYFAPWLADGAAAAKSLGIDLSSLGIKPEAVTDVQSARKSLAIVAGEILRDIMGQGQRQITNKDLNSFISATPGIETDPGALRKILGWARSQAVYNAEMAHSFVNRQGDVGTWERQWYQGQNGRGNFGPIFDPLSGEMRQSGSSSQAPAPTSAVQAPSAAVAHLRSNPALASQFDEKYGQGAAQRALSQ